jgi:CheY-like chemotaxis protein
VGKEKCRILCIDDHRDTSEMLQLVLSHEDYEVFTEQSMAGAIALSKRESFDLFVIDKRLPDGSGLELVARLQELAPQAPCIFYTGDAYEIHRQQAIAAGADAFVAKPDIDKLIETVHRLMKEQVCAAASSAE